MTVSAVTVTWNSRDAVGGLLSSLAGESGDVSEVIVVDNGSTDGTPGYVREGFPAVRLIENIENRGFAAGANQGITASSGEYVLLVNPDVSFTAGFVGELVAALEHEREAGAAAPKLVRPDGHTVDSAGLLMQRNRKAVDIGREEKDDGRYGAARRVFGPCGAASMLRRSMLEDVKDGAEYYDESFFSYKEDVDLAWRMNLMGWRSLYVPNAVATHGRGWKESSRKSVPHWVRRHSHKNRYLTMIKDDDLANFIADLPSILLYEAKLFAYALFREPFLLLAFKDVLALLPRTLSKRKRIMKRRRLSPHEVRETFYPSGAPL